MTSAGLYPVVEKAEGSPGVEGWARSERNHFLKTGRRQEIVDRGERERVLEMSVVNCNDCIVIVSCYIDRLRENFYDSSQYNFYSQEQFVK